MATSLPLTLTTTLVATMDEKDVSLTPSRTRLPLLSRAHLFANVDPTKATAPMVAYCFLSGWMDVIVFSAISGWPGFQTGNSAQLALALARTIQDHTDGRNGAFLLPDRLALASLMMFVLGVFCGAKIGDRIGSKTRGWLCIGTFIQALLTMAAAFAIWQSGQGSVMTSRGGIMWSNAKAYIALSFICSSLGLQAVMAKRLSTEFGTTIVLTTTWVELASDRTLLHVWKLVSSRDHKIMGIVALMSGAFLGRVVLEVTNSATTLAVATGFRVLIAMSFLWVQGESS